ncbi:hypothetical protein E2C01_025275 [Portunus trituberculatus]|uniref:Uncharacterized protein n=1 Tax=Portunus trituberculatus TaxID=210409 RepID=A0A5B7EHF9_PORTR|nr:hypothetical protein [Portunus trituberculatus]
MLAQEGCEPFGGGGWTLHYVPVGCKATLHCCSDTAQATFWQATNSPCLAYGQASVSYTILKVLLRD